MADYGDYKQDKPDWFDTAKYAAFEWAAGQTDQERQQLWARALFIRRILVMVVSVKNTLVLNLGQYIVRGVVINLDCLASAVIFGISSVIFL